MSGDASSFRPTPPPSPPLVSSSLEVSTSQLNNRQRPPRPTGANSPERKGKVWNKDDPENFNAVEKTTETTSEAGRTRPSPKTSSSSAGSSSWPSQPSSSEGSYTSETEAKLPSSPKARDKDASRSHGQADADKDKVLKLSPTRLGELLVDTPTPFVLEMPNIPEVPPVSTSTRHRSSTTSSAITSPTSSNALPARPPGRGRMLSTPTTTRRGKSSPRLEIITSPLRDSPHPPSRRQSEARMGSGDRNSHKITNQTLSMRRASNDATYDVHSRTPESSVPSSANINTQPSSGYLKPPDSSASLPPLPLQSYLSMALSSPTLQTNFSHSSPLKADSAPHTYGSAAHHPDNTFEISMERIMNFLLLPPKLEGTLIFGVLACLDSWLYIFTILPLRFLKAIGVLMEFWWRCIQDYFNYEGNKLKKQRRGPAQKPEEQSSKARSQRRRREKKVSGLLPSHKADILRGLVVFVSCWFLMRFDASMMYHSIRGQSGVKLYVIYNMLEFGDRLCSAIGQDIFECLFAAEILERGPDGRSQILRPFGFLLLALVYNILHSLCLFYQVITLNVAVNSYSNALVTLLLSVQFVEIKATVFKKFEKENLFQLAMSDVVERFQLLLMLFIIGSRNMVEMGVFSLSGAGSGGGLLPKSFTFFPKWTGQLMGPFIMVLGSEMCVDWLKHAYITKFNNTRPVVYERFLDVQCKDYYSHAFSDQNLTKRLGLPVIPLACLFIRAAIQTYHMFLATHVPLPPPSVTTSIAESSDPTSETNAALANFDAIIRRALGGSSFGGNTDPTSSITDDVIAATTMVIFLLACFLVFLAAKLVLGICLLSFARRRYKGMKERERMNTKTGARAVGGFGLVEVSEEQRSHIYEGDASGEEGARKRERIGREREMKTDMVDLDTVTRYAMVAKRIW